MKSFVTILTIATLGIAGAQEGSAPDHMKKTVAASPEQIQPLLQSLERRLSVALAHVPAEQRDPLLQASNALGAERKRLVRLIEYRTVLGTLGANRQEDDDPTDEVIVEVVQEVPATIIRHRTQSIEFDSIVESNEASLEEVLESVAKDVAGQW